MTWRGTDAGDRLGNPVADTMALAGHRVTYFERGLVVTSPLRGQVVRVAGPVYPRYRELDDIAGPLGPPVASAVASATGAVQQTFASGHIVHHPGSGTHVLEVAGAVNPGTSDGPDRAPVALDLVGSPSSGAGCGASAVILLTGGAGVVQVTDEGGHRLSAAAGGVMTGNGRPGEVAAGIPGLLRLARLPRHGALPGGQLFSTIGEHAGLRFDVARERPPDNPTESATDSAADTSVTVTGTVAGTAAGTAADEIGEYCWAAWMAGCAVRVTAVATPVPDRLTAEHLGTPGRGISVEVPRDGSARPFAISIQAAGGAHPRLPHVRQYFLGEVMIAAGQRISLRIDDGGAELLATNHGPPTSVLLRIGAVGPGRPSPPRRATLAAGATTVFRPLDWSAEGSASRAVCVEVRDTPNGPARVAIAELGGDLPDVR